MGQRLILGLVLGVFLAFCCCQAVGADRTNPTPEMLDSWKSQKSMAWVNSAHVVVLFPSAEKSSAQSWSEQEYL